MPKRKRVKSGEEHKVMSIDDDDKPTVILDLNAIRKEKQKQEEDLANIAQDLEFAVVAEENIASPHSEPAPKKTLPEVKAPTPPVTKASAPSLTATALAMTPEFEEDNLSSEEFAEQFLENRAHEPAPTPKTKLILFDFQSDFFEKSRKLFPEGHEYQIARTLPELNKILSSKVFQIVVFNYDVNPKAVNQLTAQIKKKFPMTKTMIIAKSISPEKAKLHAATASGANGYYKLPLDPKKIDDELKKIKEAVKKVA